MRLASTYRGQGKLESAEQLGLEVLTTCQASLGTNHPVTLTCLENLASTYQNQGRLSDAGDFRKRGLEISKIVHGETHVETLMLMSNLSATIRYQGRLEEAKDLGGKALRRMREAGLDHHMGVPMARLAVTYHMLQLGPEAEALATRALRLMEEIYGEGDLYTIYAMVNLSIICQSQNKLEAAKDLAETVYARRERIFGKDHPVTAAALENLRQISYAGGSEGISRRLIRGLTG
ncbi:hypothetical protein N7463_009557 [Penicillium fimorum]|uniref:Uncharacterized protein n=1 Tax=Penicillium fimorum TaxID=1882269 RepID=A0A9W9XS63_9EURO|nr:hypothetical protein N7463_009557 [Penicillium fimorum]